MYGFTHLSIKGAFMVWEVTDTGTVDGLFLKPVLHADSVPVPELTVVVGEGIKGDSHGGTRLSDSREDVLKAIGVGKEVPVANVRQFSAISAEELRAVSEVMYPAGHDISPDLLEPNLLLSGIEGLSQLPPGTLLTFAGRKAVLAVWAENHPCKYPHEKIMQAYPDVPAAVGFASSARGRRGIVGFVYCSGKIRVGDEVYVWREKA